MPRRTRNPAAAATQLLELGVSVPQVMAARLQRMAQAGATPSARDRREFAGMVMEKPFAFAQAWMAMWTETAIAQQQLALSLLSGAGAAQGRRERAAPAQALIGAEVPGADAGGQPPFKPGLPAWLRCRPLRGRGEPGTRCARLSPVP